MDRRKIIPQRKYVESKGELEKIKRAITKYRLKRLSSWNPLVKDPKELDKNEKALVAKLGYKALATFAIERENPWIHKTLAKEKWIKYERSGIRKKRTKLASNAPKPFKEAFKKALEKKIRLRYNDEQLVNIAINKNPSDVFKTLIQLKWIEHKTKVFWGHTKLGSSAPKKFKAIFSEKKAKKIKGKLGSKYNHLFNGINDTLPQIGWLSQQDSDKKLKKQVEKYRKRYGIDETYLSEALKESVKSIFSYKFGAHKYIEKAKQRRWLEENGLKFQKNPPCPKAFKETLTALIKTITGNMSKVHKKEKEKKQIIGFTNKLKRLNIINLQKGSIHEKKIDPSLLSSINLGLENLIKKILDPALSKEQRHVHHKLARDIHLINEKGEISKAAHADAKIAYEKGIGKMFKRDRIIENLEQTTIAEELGWLDNNCNPTNIAPKIFKEQFLKNKEEAGKKIATSIAVSTWQHETVSKEKYTPNYIEAGIYSHDLQAYIDFAKEKGWIEISENRIVLTRKGELANLNDYKASSQEVKDIHQKFINNMFKGTAIEKTRKMRTAKKLRWLDNNFNPTNTAPKIFKEQLSKRKREVEKKIPTLIAVSTFRHVTVGREKYAPNYIEAGIYSDNLQSYINFAKEKGWIEILENRIVLTRKGELAKLNRYKPNFQEVKDIHQAFINNILKGTTIEKMKTAKKLGWLNIYYNPTNKAPESFKEQFLKNKREMGEKIETLIAVNTWQGSTVGEEKYSLDYTETEIHNKNLQPYLDFAKSENWIEISEDRIVLTQKGELANLNHHVKLEEENQYAYQSLNLYKGVLAKDQRREGDGEFFNRFYNHYHDMNIFKKIMSPTAGLPISANDSIFQGDKDKYNKHILSEKVRAIYWGLKKRNTKGKEIRKAISISKNGVICLEYKALLQYGIDQLSEKLYNSVHEALEKKTNEDVTEKIFATLKEYSLFPKEDTNLKEQKKILSEEIVRLFSLSHIDAKKEKENIKKIIYNTIKTWLRENKNAYIRKSGLTISEKIRNHCDEKAIKNEIVKVLKTCEEQLLPKNPSDKKYSKKNRIKDPSTKIYENNKSIISFNQKRRTSDIANDTIQNNTEQEPLQQPNRNLTAKSKTN